jgi:hypothetical protein
MSELAILRQLQSQHLINEEQAAKQPRNCVMICGLEQTLLGYNAPAESVGRRI